MGTFLRDVQKESLQEVWDGIGSRHLDRDYHWFLRTFVSAEAAEAHGTPGTAGPGSFEDVWPQVRKLNLYDPLTLLAAGLMIAAAIPLGVYAATHHRRWGDYLTMILSQLGVAVPGFWAGLLLILLFSVRLGWVQAGGFDGWGQGIWHGVRSLLVPS